jgi:hypothetical protein
LIRSAVIPDAETQVKTKMHARVARHDFLTKWK